MLKGRFKKYNDACIDAFLNKKSKPLLQNMKGLSKIVLENFKPMIPKVYHKLWQDGIDSKLITSSSAVLVVVVLFLDLPKILKRQNRN